MHRPVLVEAVVEALEVKPGGHYIDATAGEGGHIRKFIEAGGEVLALDWDSAQVEKLAVEFQDEKRVQFVNSNFANIAEAAKSVGFTQVDGVLFDLGLSMRQIQESGKGFSYKAFTDPLDMRLGKTRTTAEAIVNTLSEEELYELFAKYGEELNSLEIAKAIVRSRVRHRLKTVEDLISAIQRGLKHTQVKDFEYQKTYARIFQALRIAVNNEFENLKKGLVGAMKVLKKGGRVAVITFHSREDRIVKQFMKVHKLRSPLKKTVHGSYERSYERSALLRVFEV